MKDADTCGYAIDGRRFDLSGFVDKVEKRSNHFVIGFFDCCRTLHVEATVAKGHESLSTTSLPTKTEGQACIIFSARPKTPAIARTDGSLSLATASFLEHMKKSKTPFPHCLSNWSALTQKPEMHVRCQMEVQLLPSMTQLKLNSAAESSSASDPVMWSVDQVCQWFETIKLGEYNELLRSAKIDGEEMWLMTLQDWKELGISAFGDVKKLQRGFSKLGKNF